MLLYTEAKLSTWVKIRPLAKSAYSKLFFLLISQQNICCGYQREPSKLDGSFENPKQMFKLMGKEKMTILMLNFFLPM